MATPTKTPAKVRKPLNPKTVAAPAAVQVEENLSLSNKGTYMTITIQSVGNVDISGKSTKGFNEAYPDGNGFFHALAREARSMVVLSAFSELPQATQDRIISLGLQRHVAVAMIPSIDGQTKLDQLQIIVDELNNGYSPSRASSGSTGERVSKILTDEQLQSKTLMVLVNKSRTKQKKTPYTTKAWAVVWSGLSEDVKTSKLAHPVAVAQLATFTALNDLLRKQQSEPSVSATEGDDFSDL